MNAEQQKAVERLLQSSVSFNNKNFAALQTALSLITELEADARRLDWIQETRCSVNFAGSIDAKFYIQEQNQVMGSIARNTDVRQAIDAAMKGAK